MILEKICKDKKNRLEMRKKEISIEKLIKLIECEKYNLRKSIFENAIKKEGLSIIGEAKKASPSKGVINKNFNIEKIIRNYDLNEVRAISILTEENYFMGSLSYLKIARELTQKPLLRKDFIIDIYELYESKAYGADAVLLIVAVLGEKIKEFYLKAVEIGLEVLVEVHNIDEIKIALDAGVKIIGINNRDLKTFKTDIKITEKLLNYIDDDKLIISESGVSNLDDIRYIESIGVDAVLIGEFFMR